jgi:rhamnosyltransferase
VSYPQPGVVASEPACWRVCAVIVSFHPDEGFCGRALRIAEQVDGVVIVENESDSSAVGHLAPLASRSGVHLIRNPTNLGIATALNQGIEYAREKAYTHALLFDQDTDPVQHMVSTIRQVASGCDDIERAAVIGVNLFDASTGKPWFDLKPTRGCATEVRTVITSGSLVSVQIAAQLGAFRDDFFIDHVDEEYCLRARARGYKVLIVNEPLAVHALGAPKYQRFLWRTIGTTNHSASRRYYMMRNYIMTARMYGLREPAWVIRTLHVRLKSFLLLLLLDDDRISKLHHIASGLRDGLAGRTGKLQSDWLHRDS